MIKLTVRTFREHTVHPLFNTEYRVAGHVDYYCLMSNMSVVIYLKRLSVVSTCVELIETVFTALHGRRGLAMRILSVCLSVRPSHAWIVTKQ